MATTPLDPDVNQLINDVNAVFAFRTKKIEDFPPDYQIRMKNYYRFSANRYYSSEAYVVSRTTDTLDTV